MNKNVCNYCHIAFDPRLDKCPQCKRYVKDEKIIEYKEGEGRKHFVGGEACDYCSHCYGTANWCPFMD